MNYRLFSLMCLQICVISALKDLSVKVENNLYVFTPTFYDSLEYFFIYNVY